MKGTTNGTITDFDGNFTLNAPRGSILSISYIGYKSTEVAAAPSLTVTLKDDSQVLNDVVKKPNKYAINGLTMELRT